MASITAAAIAEAVSAMEGAKIFMEQNCKTGDGRIDHMIRLDISAKLLKCFLNSIKVEVQE